MAGFPCVQVADYTYVGLGRVDSRLYANGVTKTQTFDAERRLTHVDHRRANNSRVAEFDYAFDKVGNRLKETFLHENTQDVYRYDSQGRLEFEARSEIPFQTVQNNQAFNPLVPGFAVDTRTWTLDGANNWLGKADTVDGAAAGTATFAPTVMNEYSSIDFGSGPVARTHNPNGNLRADGTNSYIYDAFNRLVRVNSGVDIAFYAYDPNGRRIRREVVNSGALDETFVYYYAGETVLEEGDAAGTPVRQYVWGPDGLLQLATALAFFVHENGYGSITHTTDAAQDERDSRDYNAYGEFSERGGGQATGLKYAFRGMRFDPETSLYSLATGSYYQASLGRTICRGMGALLNLYAYMGNNPIVWYGYEFWDWVEVFQRALGWYGRRGRTCGGGRRPIPPDPDEAPPFDRRGYVGLPEPPPAVPPGLPGTTLPPISLPPFPPRPPIPAKPDMTTTMDPTGPTPDELAHGPLTIPTAPPKGGGPWCTATPPNFGMFSGDSFHGYSTPKAARVAALKSATRELKRIKPFICFNLNCHPACNCAITTTLVDDGPTSWQKRITLNNVTLVNEGWRYRVRYRYKAWCH